MFKYKYVFAFIVLVLMQTLLFNNMRISGFINPQIYLFFVLMLPVHTRGYILLLLAFVLGFVIDIFSDSMAIHTMATLFMAFCRPAALRLVTGKISLEGVESPSFSGLGTIALLLYAFILVFLHHTALFFLEIFRFNEMINTLSRVFASSVITMIFVVFFFALTENSAIKKRR